MSSVILFNSSPGSIDYYIGQIASASPSAISLNGETVTFSLANLKLIGIGFAYDTIGRLIAGTVTSLSAGLGGTGSTPGSYESIQGVAIPVPTLLQYISQKQSIVPLLFGGSNTITVNTDNAYSASGDNVFKISSPGSYPYMFPFPGVPIVDHTLIAIGGTAGVDTADFSSTFDSNDLRGDATLSGGGGNEGLYLHGPHIPSSSFGLAPDAVVVHASLTLVDTLRFIDGSTYEDNAAPGAQAALMFEGIFGRLPDAVNAGGFALVADQSGRVAAAAQMLATQEGGGDTAGLTNQQFVTRLYENMLHREPEAQGAAGWQQVIDSGQLSRAEVTARFATGIEAQQANFAAFATGSVFAADPNAVEVLRAYELLLNREPEAKALSVATRSLNGGQTLQSLYTTVQSSQEFANDGANPYGITSATSYASVYAAAHADPFNATITSLVTAQGVSHLA